METPQEKYILKSGQQICISSNGFTFENSVEHLKYNLKGPENKKLWMRELYTGLLQHAQLVHLNKWNKIQNQVQ